MSIRMSLLAVVACLPLAGSARGQTPTIESVLSDRTGVLFLVDDVSSLRANVEESPLATMWGDAAREPEAGPSGFIVRRIQGVTGLSIPAILNHFNAEAAVVLPELRFLIAPTEDDVEWAVAATTTGDAPWQKLAKDLKAAKSGLGTSRTRKISAETMHVFVSGQKDSSLAWAWSNGIGFLASSPKALEGLIAARKGASHLDQTENWRSLERGTQQGDMTLYVSLEGMDAWLGNRIAGGPADSLGAMMGITPRSVVGALGLGAFHAARVTAKLQAEETQVDGGVLVQEGPGLSRLLAYLPGPVERPSIIPPDAVFASTSRFGIADFWRGLLDLLDRVSPGLSFFAQGQIQKIAQTAGLDFEKDILSNLGDETFLAYLPRHDDRPDSIAGAFDQLSGIRIKDPSTMLKAVAALVDWAPTGAPDETTETRSKTKETHTIHGVSVTTVQFGPEEKGSTLAYAVLDSTLLVSMGEKDILARALETRAGGASLWNRPDLVPLLASIPPEASSINYWDPSSLEQTIRDMDTSQGMDEHRLLAKTLLRHFGPSLAFTVKTSEGYFTHVRLRRAGD